LQEYPPTPGELKDLRCRCSLVQRLLLLPNMARKSPVDATRAVIVVGGSGGMSEHYRAVVAERGLELRHLEKRVPNGARRVLGRVAAVFIMVGMVSHALRDQVRALVPDGTPVVYLRSASVSALRTAVASLDATSSSATS
jgi:hypothetical protein